VKVLLDTQVWLWMHVQPSRLTPRTRGVLVDPKTELLLSVASIWEIAIKYQIGRLALPTSPRAYVLDRMARNGVRALPIVAEHVFRAGELPPHHRDPFDRLLVAQAQVERIPIVTADPKLKRYDVRVIRA